MPDLRPQQSKLRLKDRRRRLVWVKVAAGAGVVLAAFALVFYVARLPSVTVSTVAVSGTNLVSADAVQALAEKDLSGSYAFLIPHANALAVPVVAIQKDIERAYPAVAKVALSIKNFHTLDIAVTEREAAAVWCAGAPSGEIASDGNASSTPAESTARGCYLMDAGGFVYAAATDTPPLLRYYGTLSGNPIGSTFLSGGFQSLATVLTDIGNAIHRTPTEILVDNDTTDVSVAFTEGGVLRFTRSTDTTSTVQNIASVFASQSFATHPNFEYVDFRFGDKVYVKFK